MSINHSVSFANNEIVKQFQAQSRLDIAGISKIDEKNSLSRTRRFLNKKRLTDIFKCIRLEKDEQITYTDMRQPLNIALLAYQDKEYQKAFAYFTQLSQERDDATIHYHLGVMYYLGQYVEKNHQQALYYFFKAAKKGHIESQKYVDRFYRYDHRVIIK